MYQSTLTITGGTIKGGKVLSATVTGNAVVGAVNLKPTLSLKTLSFTAVPFKEISRAPLNSAGMQIPTLLILLVQQQSVRALIFPELLSFGVTLN